MSQPQPISNILKPRFTKCPTPLNSKEFEAQVSRVSREAQRLAEGERREVARRRAEQLFARSAMPPKYAGADLAKPMPSQVEAFGFGVGYVEAFADRLRDGAGLVAHGSGTMARPADVGTGKSWLICAIGNALLARERTVLYCTAMEAIQRVRKTFVKGNGTEDDVIAALVAPDLLLLDELGVQRDTDDEQRIIEQVMDGRSRMCRPTLFATNLGPDAVRCIVGMRVYDRMRDGWFVPMCGESLRGRS